MKKSLLLLVAVFQIISVIAQTQPISAKQIDSLTELVLKTFNVPGIAVGVVKDGKLIHAKGYGVANLNTGKK
jgi:CubicO group peptidase (beta-lactamase class C family)